MIDERSRKAVAAARDGAGRTWPLYGSYCFDGLPGTVERVFGVEPRRSLPDSTLPSIDGVRRVVFAYLDALPVWLCERVADEPALRRLSQGVVSTLTSMFPSTTTGHVPAAHTGLRSAESGLYEWFQYEPTCDEIVAPLPYQRAVAIDGVRHADFDPGILVPEHASTIYHRLAAAGVASSVHHRRAFESVPLNAYVTADATVWGHDEPLEAAANVERALARATGRHYAFVYVETIDTAGHRFGPGSAAYEAEARRVLGAFECGLLAPLAAQGRGDTLVLVSTDHGMAATPPDETTFVNRAWPELERLIRRDRRGNPLVAGSGRDVFLHLPPEAVEAAVAGLRGVLDPDCLVLTISEAIERGLFGDVIGERFRSRVGDVVILPGAGRAVWWDEPPGYSYAMLGQHGGLSAEEMEIPLYALVL